MGFSHHSAAPGTRNSSCFCRLSPCSKGLSEHIVGTIASQQENTFLKSDATECTSWQMRGRGEPHSQEAEGGTRAAPDQHQAVHSPLQQGLGMGQARSRAAATVTPPIHRTPRPEGGRQDVLRTCVRASASPGRAVGAEGGHHRTFQKGRAGLKACRSAGRALSPRAAEAERICGARWPPHVAALPGTQPCPHPAAGPPRRPGSLTFSIAPTGVGDF